MQKMAYVYRTHCFQTVANSDFATVFLFELSTILFFLLYNKNQKNGDFGPICNKFATVTKKCA